MYRTCIFCAADLGANESIEHFPVGRSLAFDGERGRLWAVCPKCARWNLAPIEERWEAIEEGDRCFRDSRLRVHSENIGLAKLRDGTRLIRVGGAVGAELAAWRYGGELGKRRRQFLRGAAGAAAGAAILTGSFALGLITLAPLVQFAWTLGRKAVANPELHRFPTGTLLPDQPVHLDRSELRKAHLVPDPHGGDGVALWLPRAGWGVVRGAGTEARWGYLSVTVGGSDAHSILRRGLVQLNAAGASRSRLDNALRLLARGGANTFLVQSAALRMPLVDPGHTRGESHTRLLALEMALHEETERRALEGELAALEEMWRQAEEIAAIADRLPG